SRQRTWTGDLATAHSGHGRRHHGRKRRRQGHRLYRHSTGGGGDCRVKTIVQFLAIGDWPRGAVAVHWQTQSGRRIVSEVEAAIDAAWDDAKRRPEIQLFDGPMCRLESWRASSKQLELT